MKKYFNTLLWFLKKSDKEELKVTNPQKENPFKNYKSALNFLVKDINSKTLLSNYEPTDTDFALLTLFKSKMFMNKLLNKEGRQR